MLDVAAAPGSKTTALASWVAGSGGVVVANELSGSRSKALCDNLLRTGGMPWSAVTQLDGRFVGRTWPETFDAVLLDAPCSGEAMTRRGNKTSEQWDQSDRQIGQISNLQRQMAVSSVHALKVGGVLVYSTCTMNPVENEGVVAHLEETFGTALERLPLGSLPGSEDMLTADGHLRCWPHVTDTQGFFVARFRKVAPTPAQDGSDRSTGRSVSKALEPVNRKETRQIERVFQEAFGCSLGLLLDRGLELRRRAKEIWLIPSALSALSTTGLRRSGIRLADLQARNRPYAAHFEWAVSFGLLYYYYNVIQLTSYY